MRHLLILLLLLAATWHPATAEDVPGVTDDQIRIGTIADLTGPAAFAGQETSAGARLYLQHINAQGGIHGRTIDLKVEDDGYSPPRTVAAFRKLVDRDRIFCFVGNTGTPTTTASFPFIEHARIPVVAPISFASTMHTPVKRYVFATDPSYDIQAWLIVQHILASEEGTALRLATLYQDDAMGRDGLKGLRQAAAHYGLSIVAEETYKSGAVDFSSQVLNLRRAEPTHVVFFTIYREAAAVLKEAQTTDWQPRFIGFSPAADDKIVELAGAAAAGYEALQSIDLQGTNPQIRQYHDLLQQYTPKRQARFYHAWGYWSAQILVEGLQRAGRHLTREKLVAALETFENWNQSVGPPLTYGPGLRGGHNVSAFIMRADLEQKKLVRISDDWIHFERPAEVASK
ncbi:MAG: ABC transporter substrate-binding protein [Candidatus Latescibacteria bacterium]|nr:ABC transporter substrate-binding protein [Candidatus Latescibacterota bacterium]